MAGLLRRAAFTQWWVGSGVRLEIQVVKQAIARKTGVLVSLWADHDVGFLDLVAAKLGCKLVGVFHSCPDDLHATIRSSKRLASFDSIILMSECQREFFLKMGVESNRINVIQHGIDSNYFVPPTAGRREFEEKFTVLSVGGHRRNFQRMANLCSAMGLYSDIEFVIVGPKVHQTLFASMENTTFLHNIPEEQLLELYQQCDCFFQILDQSTANNTLLEAMSCGAPIVAENVGGISEYLTGNSGILVPHNDQSGMVHKILDLKDNEIKRMEYSCLARKNAVARDWRHVARKLQSHLKKLNHASN